MPQGSRNVVKGGQPQRSPVISSAQCSLIKFTVILRRRSGGPPFFSQSLTVLG